MTGNGSLSRERDASLVIRPLSLRFADPATERRFSEASLNRALPIVRASVLAGAVLYGLFGILDYYIVPDIVYEAWTVRYLVVCPLLVAIAAFTLTRRFVRVAQMALSLSMLSAGAGVIYMTAIAGPPGSYFYYAGLIMVVIYCSSLIRLRFVYAGAMSLVLVLLYQWVAIWVNPIPVASLVNNDFFLIMSVAVGVFSSYAQELYIRRDFISNERLRQEIERADRLLEESIAANKAKSEFLAVISHELRTPLNAIIGFSEMMQQQLFGPLGSERYKAYAKDIHASGQHLLNIISEILDLSKAEAGKLELKEESIDLGEVLNRCLRMFRDRAAQRGVRLAFDIPTRPLWLYADPQMVRQVVINLVSNAVKFTFMGGAVVVSAAEDEQGRLRIVIKDTGIGIAKENLEDVVKPFVQVADSMTREHDGVGLGLPLVKRILELHGGELQIQSEHGVGTVVTARFPASRTIPEGALATQRHAEGAA